jgi:O-antigen/teichoic acid export membrane protein
VARWIVVDRDPMSARRSIRSDLGKVLTGSIGGQAVGIARGMAVPLLVTPARYGLWRLILLAWQYGMYLHLGSFALLNRELPGLLAKGEHHQVSRMRQTAFWGTMSLASLVSLGIIVYSFTPVAGDDPQRLWTLRICAFGLIAQLVMMYARLDHRVHSRFGRLSLFVFSYGLASLLTMIPLGYVAGVPGLAAGLFLSAIIVTFTFGRRDAFERPALDIRGFLRQVAQGAPISALPFLNSSIGGVGQIVSASALDLESAGYYGLGAMIGSIVYAIPRSLGKVLYPRYLATYATANDPRRMGLLLRRSLEIVSVTSTLTACGAAIVLDPVLENLFPKYLPARGATYALIAMMPFLSHALVLQNALLAFRLHRQVILLQVFFVLVSAGLSLTGAIVFGDVAWVAIGIMLASVGYGLSMMWLSFSATGAEDRSALREVLSELTPVVIMGGLTIALLIAWNPAWTRSSSILESAAQLLAIGPIAAFYCVRIWRSTRGSGN